MTSGERSCGTCTLCCKVLGVLALQKPEGTWCQHCITGRGCGIYETRPEECRSFGCLWLSDPNFPAALKPERSKVVFFLADGGAQVGAMVDPGQPNAWRAPEIYGLLKRMAGLAVPLGRQIVVHVKGQMTAIMPDRDVPLGPFQPGKRLVYRNVNEGAGNRLEPVLEDDV
jgi:hypothetical protein